MWFKKAAQTISYMPYFISVVVIIGIMKEFFALNTGKINDILAVLEFDRIDFFAEPGWFRFLYIFSGIWQTVGYNSIIYLAAIAGVNPELYEVAELDGASRFKRIIHVTIPGILPTILVLFILSVGGILGNDWVKITLMYNSRTMVVADVIGTYLYRMGIGEGNFSFSTAIGLMGSVIGFGLLYTTNWVIRKFTGEGLW
jgi:putative aldouronate transport system permease protein